MSKWEVLWPEYQTFLKTVEGMRRNPTPLRKRTRDRLLSDLATWHKIVETSLFFQNPANVEFLVPLAQRNANEIINELYNRYRPRLKAYAGGNGLSSRLQADDVLRQIDPRLVFFYYLRDAEEKKGNIIAHCLFHEDTGKPNFSGRVDDGRWYCWVCARGGSIFTFVMEIEKVDFPTALKLAHEIGTGQART